MVDSQPPSDLESQGEPCDKGHVGEGKIKKSSAPCETRPNLDRRSDQRNTNLCWEHWPHVVFSNKTMQRIEIWGEKFSLITYEFLKSFQTLPCGEVWQRIQTTSQQEPVGFWWHRRHPHTLPLSADRRVFKAVLCRLAWTSGAYSLLWQFLLLFFPRLPLFDQSSPTIQKSGSVPNCQNTGQNSQRPRACLPLLSWST